MLLVAAAALVAVDSSRCTLGEDLCRVQTLDIDALRIALPESRLVRLLPDIDTLDPDDELTVGDVVELDRFAGLEIEDLLTPAEIELLLAYAD